MTFDEDHKALAEFSSRKGEAYRLVMSMKEDISRWIDEGWAVVAIYRLLKSKGITKTCYSSFRKAVKKVFICQSTAKNNLAQKQLKQDQQQTSTQHRPRPHEMQRQQANKFVTISGVDNIGLDKKD